MSMVQMQGLAPQRQRATMSDPNIAKFKTDKVCVFYGAKQALKDVSLDIYSNQVTALIGPSGCGKSTYLRCLNRMNDTIDGCRVTGSIRLDGEDIYSRDMDVVHLRARVGMVFQKPNPFPKPIFENVAYGPRIHGLAKDKHELEQIVHEALQRAGLLKEVEDRLQQPGTGLSGGQQQRLCIARAIAVQPEVILMDEPCSALDPIATAKNRGADRRAAGELHDRHRHPLDAAGGAGFAAYRVFPPRNPGGDGLHRNDLHQSQRQAHAGLHHRPVRLGCEQCDHGDDWHELRSYRQVVR